ncbi:hypothetical protein KBK19_15675 [Microvirga sp. STR05]|uniref:Glutaminyl-tRNA synthetase n=1 Tax=Hymenobacter duratus TaxID=2771356 RepID=A0ABR8JI03_9BACT|nr:DUF6370 family protein [Hymenobacter duratus]MBD2716481.1 hypothetical protein [Hymenobacter duratus]MBR7951396.1 hypothetical protein [Microvirga sp. STR05]
MKLLWMLLLSFSSVATVQAQTAKPAASAPAPDPAKPLLLAEAACGQCRLGLPGKGCDLAVRLDGKAYFVDGTTIDSHGDAHADDGLCNAIRQAQVQGKVVANRFVAMYFRLLPEATEGR